MATMTVAQQSRAQRLGALRRANRVRSEKARLKRQLHSLGRVGGPRLAADLLAHNAPELAAARVQELLTSTPGIGPTKARQIEGMCTLRPLKRVGELHGRQREALARELLRVAQRAEERAR